ncbi:uncharacterized protein LOC134658972 [Cydia amplana]|uniref:uncharacterized protein LOC134658972 n=1 Tax=Cydia amplana TaxID=1869771 RepID=UPI002FE5D3D7
MDSINTISKAIILPEKSGHKYKKSYDSFMTWKSENNITSYSEDVLLKYYENLDSKFKPTTLWTEYSKLKSCLMFYNQIDISKYKKLTEFLKRKSNGFEAKKAKIFTKDQLEKFIIEASDQFFLHIKVAVIFGIMGACRRQELYNLKAKDVIDSHNTLTVRIVNCNTNQIDRKFTISGPYYDICKKYMDLRPRAAKINNCFFLRYFDGRCHGQKVGINKFGAMGTVVAKELKLSNPELYTGHCFKRTSVDLRKSWPPLSESCTNTLKTENDSLTGKLRVSFAKENI